jgi:hypothetical protein
VPFDDVMTGKASLGLAGYDVIKQISSAGDSKLQATARRSMYVSLWWG